MANNNFLQKNIDIKEAEKNLERLLASKANEIYTVTEAGKKVGHILPETT